MFISRLELFFGKSLPTFVLRFGDSRVWGTEFIFLVCIAGLLQTVGCCLYAMGGTKGFGLPLRRFVGSGVIAIALNLVGLAVHNWHWQYASVYPALILGFVLPYGGDTLKVKLMKRTLFFLGCMVASVLCLTASSFSFSSWMVLILQFVVGSFSIAIGVMNPWGNAPIEQFFVCQCLTLFLFGWPLVK